MVSQLDPLLPEAEVDPTSDPALDWPTDPWDNLDRTDTVERLRRQNRIGKFFVYSVLWGGLLAVLALGAVGWLWLERINPAGDPGAVEAFTVADGEPLEDIADRLESAGLVSDASTFMWYVDRKGGLEVAPGYYELRPNDHMGNVMGRLAALPEQTARNVTFPEGFTLEQISLRLDAEFERLSAEDFMTATGETNISSLEPVGGASSLEGLLFPDTYAVSNADSESQLIERMVALMERVGDQEDIVSKSAALGRTPYETLIIASMIEKEAKVPEERALMSRVIHNRLFVTANNPDDPFPLQVDAPVWYGRNQLGIEPSVPFPEVRQIPSDWNTYLLPGLPKTPIANPGRASIRAALNPAPNPSQGDPICRDLPDPDKCFLFFYVIADEDGSHAFAATGEQHQANVEAAARAGLLDG